jgi:hypothetical protein
MRAWYFAKMMKFLGSMSICDVAENAFGASLCPMYTYSPFSEHRKAC